MLAASGIFVAVLPLISPLRRDQDVQVSFRGDPACVGIRASRVIRLEWTGFDRRRIIQPGSCEEQENWP